MRIKEKKADEAGIGAFISSYLFKKLKDFHYPPEVMMQILAQVLYVVFKDYCKQYKELGLETEQFKVQEKLQLVISEENPYRDFFHNKSISGRK